MAHNPNPFDFVPFAEPGPTLKTVEAWSHTADPLLTGYFDVTLTALTPLHVVGDQTAREQPVPDRRRSNFEITASDFFRQNNAPLIPASTLRGCLRAFLEAASNGWASQLTPFYEKEARNRHVGFRVLDKQHPDTKNADPLNIDAALDTAVPPAFYAHPDDAEPARVDLAAYLFGCVLPDKKQDSGAGFKGRVIIEDAVIDPGSLARGETTYQYGVPDIDDTAFMGGGKPSASSWWYLNPYGIRKRRPNSCEFLGKGFRGRKFYYHQHPKACVDWYFNEANWKSRRDHPLYRIPLECLRPGAATQPFRVYFEELPEPFVKLLIFLLKPGRRIRHKLGYGKAYGYGSFDLNWAGTLKLRAPRRSSDDVRQQMEQCEERLRHGLQTPELLIDEAAAYLHAASLNKLAQILWYDADAPLIFTYPPFGRGGFWPMVQANNVRDLLDAAAYQRFQSGQLVPLSPAKARTLAEDLIKQHSRPALHFEVYQQHARGYADIQRRSF